MKRLMRTYHWISLFMSYKGRLFSPAPTLRSWVRIPLRHGCLCVFCVRFLCFYIVSSETVSWPNKKVNEDLSLDKPLHVIYKVSKLAYRIWVILIANERVTKRIIEQINNYCFSYFYALLFVFHTTLCPAEYIYFQYLQIPTTKFLHSTLRSR
jgi:hypothetical protein